MIQNVRVWFLKYAWSAEPGSSFKDVQLYYGEFQSPDWRSTDAKMLMTSADDASTIRGTKSNYLSDYHNPHAG